ncbi:MAG: hypothetical protein ABI666_00540 [Ferruginibacter sp.]
MKKIITLLCVVVFSIQVNAQKPVVIPVPPPPPGLRTPPAPPGTKFVIAKPPNHSPRHPHHKHYYKKSKHPAIKHH